MIKLALVILEKPLFWGFFAGCLPVGFGGVGYCYIMHQCQGVTSIWHLGYGVATVTFALLLLRAVVVYRRRKEIDYGFFGDPGPYAGPW